jgi:hypothetical protein
MLLFGASRVENLDDFWFVKVNRSSLKVEAAERLNIKDRDGLTTRNSMASAKLPNGKLLFMGG